MPTRGLLDEALSRAMRFLTSRQLPDGEFGTFVSSDHLMIEDGQFDSTPFTTALVLYTLRFADGHVAADMRARARDFLLSEREGPGVWRFWTSKSMRHRSIPPDLDDTCCSAFALKDFGVAPPATERVVLANRNRNGLFHTWLVPRRPFPTSLHSWRVVLPEAPFCLRSHPFWRFTEAAPDDVDGVVNANVLLYLGEREETLPAVRYLLEILASGREESCDKWHLNRFNVYYMISRAYFNGVRSLSTACGPIVDRITSAVEGAGPMDTPLETALAACALLNCGDQSSVLDRLAEQLVTTQNPDGSWAAAPLYYGGPKRVYGWGSEELTTALAVEAIARYQGSRGPQTGATASERVGASRPVGV